MTSKELITNFIKTGDSSQLINNLTKMIQTKVEQREEDIKQKIKSYDVEIVDQTQKPSQSSEDEE